ncbi:energy transducer TonB [Zhouia sp. PK063]|uniref:energy transducer TonB n=1 Tax=Zhouia sp. PK063 TaxID=3373602 RepID=UPI0037975E1B
MMSNLCFYTLLMFFFCLANLSAQNQYKVVLVNGDKHKLKVEDLSTDSLIAATIAKKTDVPPVYKGCENANDKKSCFRRKIIEHIAKNFRYPEEARKNKQEGKVFVAFTIDVDGSVKRVGAIGPFLPLCIEAMKLIKTLPRIKPATSNGKYVAINAMIPINFEINKKHD